MGVAQRTNVPAFVPVGAIRPRLGRSSSEYWGRGRLARRETRVKLLSPALVARETCVKLCRCAPGGNFARIAATPPSNTTTHPATPWHRPQTLPRPR